MVNPIVILPKMAFIFLHAARERERERKKERKNSNAIRCGTATTYGISEGKTASSVCDWHGICLSV